MEAVNSIQSITKQIKEALDLAGLLLTEVRDNRLYKDMGYKSFSAYVVGEFDFARASAYRMMKQVEIAEKTSLVRDNLSQRAAAALNKIPEDYQVLVANTLYHRAASGKVTEGEIESAGNILFEMAATGHVSSDEDTVQAIEGAFIGETYERLKRQKQHIRDNGNGNEVYNETFTVGETPVCIPLPIDCQGKCVKVMAWVIDDTGERNG